MEYPSYKQTAPVWVLPKYLEEAEKVFAAAEVRLAEESCVRPVLNEDFQALRWFPLPHEAAKELGEKQT